MITELLVVTGQGQDIANTVGGCPEDIRLHRQPVAVAAHHLKIRFEAFLHHEQGCCPAGHTHNRSLVVGDIDGIHHTFQRSGFFFDGFNFKDPDIFFNETFFFSNKIFNRLPKDLQAAILQAGKDAGTYGRIIESSEDIQKLSQVNIKKTLHVNPCKFAAE